MLCILTSNQIAVSHLSDDGDIDDDELTMITVKIIIMIDSETNGAMMLLDLMVVINKFLKKGVEYHVFEV